MNFSDYNNKRKNSAGKQAPQSATGKQAAQPANKATFMN